MAASSCSNRPFRLHLLLFITAASLLVTVTTAQQQLPFTCTTPNATCKALVDYRTPNATTLNALRTLFDVKNLRAILGANNLSLATPATHRVPANQTIKIPIPCICNSGTGISNRRPVYTVVPGDGLYHIAAEVFAGLVTYPQIQAVNNITDADTISAGRRLWIPLPCSCDDVDGGRVVHYAHYVAAGSSVDGIAAEFNVSGETLVRVNNMSSPQQLYAGTFLDVPLRACSSMITNNSLDYPLLVPNNAYAFTATNCVMCRCDAAMNWMLQCEPSGVNSSCPPIRCSGAESSYLGNTTTSGCNRTTCAYAGYNRSSGIQTMLSMQSTCPASNNGSSSISLQGWRWNELVILVHVVLLFISFRK